MSTYYVAAFLPEQMGGFSIFFPDFKGCMTQSETLEEGIENAADALILVLEALTFRKKDIPPPSSLHEVRLKMEAYIKEIGANIAPHDIIYQLIKAPSLDLAPVKITVSLPRSILELADAKAQEFGYTRSGFLARAVQDFR